MATPDITRIRTDYDRAVAEAAWRRATAIAAARAAGITQKAIIEATGYSRASVRAFELEATPPTRHPACDRAAPADPGLQCTDVLHHFGVHTHLRAWWPNDTYPAGTGPCPAPHCTLYDGHPGRHHLVEPRLVEDADCPF